MTKKITFKFKNGVEITGTVEQLEEYARLVGEKFDFYNTHYLSSTRGLIPLSDMNVAHLKNAVLKHSREYFDDLSKRQLSLSLKDFMTEFVKFGEDPKLAGLFAELRKRPEFKTR